MRHPKSASHIATLILGFASFVSLADCTGLTGHHGTPGGAGTAGAAGSSGGATGGTTGVAGTTVVAGGGGSGTGVGGNSGGASSGVAGNGTAGSVAGSGASGAGGLGGGGTWAGGGRGGSGGAAGSGGGAPTRGPTPAANGVNFPFPQNRESSRCVYPTGYLNSHVVGRVRAMEGRHRHQQRRRRRPPRAAAAPPTRSTMYTPANSTVSEGIAYGMMIAVYMNDRPLFDDLWNYEQKHLNGNGLMNWSINADGMGAPAWARATDADEDMAFALVMADRQWGATRRAQLPESRRARSTTIWNHEIIDSKLLGTATAGATGNNINISYFAPAFYRIFKQVDPGHDWDAGHQDRRTTRSSASR